MIINCYFRHVPTVFETDSVEVQIGNDSYILGLFDTAGQEEFDRLRNLSYPNTDIFVVCFSVVKQKSLYNVEEIWVPEIKHYCPNVPFILVGTQIDLREDFETLKRLQSIKEKTITPEMGEKIANKLGAKKYLECSALTQKGVNDVFNEAIIATFEVPKKRPNNKCCCSLQ